MIPAQRLGQDERRAGLVDVVVDEQPVRNHPVDPAGVVMEAVEPAVKVDIDQDQDPQARPTPRPTMLMMVKPLSDLRRRQTVLRR